MTDMRPWIGFNPNDPEDREMLERIHAEHERRDREAVEAFLRDRDEREAERVRATTEAKRRAAIEARRREQGIWETPFVPTSAANLIHGAIDRCLRFGQNALIIGSPGVGKTRALEEAVRRSSTLEGPSVGLVTVSSVMGASTMAVFEEVAPCCCPLKTGQGLLG